MPPHASASASPRSGGILRSLAGELELCEFTQQSIMAAASSLHDFIVKVLAAIILLSSLLFEN